MDAIERNDLDGDPDPKHRECWTRLQAFPFDDPEASSPFSARLTRERGLTRREALRAMEEYRRFLFLAVAAGHAVCPSEAIDEVWHLHLTFTRSYWEDLCGSVLGMPLHHEPSRGGVDQARRHERMYRDTLASYRRFFGEPDPDLWPTVEERFAPRQRRTVDPSRSWVVPRPSRALWRRLLPPPGSLLRQWSSRTATNLGNAALAATAVPTLVLAALPNPFDLSGPRFLALYGGLLAITIVAAAALRQLLRVRTDDRASSHAALANLGTYDAAYLAGGAEQLFQTALVSLIERGLVALDRDDRGRPALVPNGASMTRSGVDSVEHSILAALETGADPRKSTARLAVRDEAERIAARLEGLGLLETKTSFAAAGFWPAMSLLALASFGAAKVVIGIQRERPVGFLVMLLVLTVALAVFFGIRPRLTLRGRALLHELRQRSRRLARSTSKQVHALENLDAPLLASQVALLGPSALSGTYLADARRWLRSEVASTDGAVGAEGSGGGGDGGGDGGGGGGGCGGCGGSS